MNTNSLQLQSKVIDFLRFPLCVAVVLIHSVRESVSVRGVENLPVYATTQYLFSEILARTAVPLFFLISGYLFFANVSTFTPPLYLTKIKKRTRSLLVPYLFWNLLLVGYEFCAQTFANNMLSGLSKLVVDYTLRDWLLVFWNADLVRGNVTEGFGQPICFQLWFVRDLMVVMLFSPVFFLLIRRFGRLVPVALGALFIADLWTDVPGFEITAPFFFSVGAYFGIGKRSFVELVKPHLGVFAMVYTVFVVVELFFRDTAWVSYWHRVGILAGIAFLVALCAKYVERGTWKPNKFLSESSFFIYACHGKPLGVLIKLSFLVFAVQSEAMVIALYFLCPAIIILVALVLYWTLKRHLPRFTAVITGGR